MKKTLVSLAAASLLVTSAVAADKGIDIVTTGQAVLYYETHADNGLTNGVDNTDLFNASKHANEFNFGVQLGLGADLGNNFTFASELQYKGTAGLDKTVGTDRQSITGKGDMNDISDEIGLSQMNISKKIGNTTVKVGRQQLPKSLSPFAYTEGWNVMKNSFEAVLAVNTDLPNTTLVGAYVGASNKVAPSGTSSFQDLRVRVKSQNNAGVTIAGSGAGSITGPIYMATIQNKSIPMTTLTASYYSLGNIGATAAVAATDASFILNTVTGTIDPVAATTAVAASSGVGADIVWVDAAIAGKDLPMGLKIGLQGGQVSVDTRSDDTTAFGAKVSIKPMDALTLTAIYTSVDDGHVGIINAGTTIKSPLYSQMVYNQHNIANDADTVVVKAAYNTGDMGTIIAQYGSTSAGTENFEDSDYTEFDLMYKLKAGGVQYFAALVVRDWDKVSTGSEHLLAQKGSDSDTRVRLWARYSF